MRPSFDDGTGRQPWIDVLRGIAILIMIPANLSPYLAEPHSMWFRVLSSFAAPLFIALSAGLVVLRADRHGLGYYLTRGALIVFVGMALDVLLWRTVPATSFDVLYVIGIGMPLVARRWSSSSFLASSSLEPRHCTKWSATAPTC